ncbi:MAG: globin [Verrucomicrobiota bacterium]
MEELIMQELGEEGIGRIVEEFYRRVPDDDLLGPMYPKNDWDGAEERLRDFLLFRFGGKQDYLIKRGHPRLRMRHMPFSIGKAERDRWLMLMSASMDEVGVQGEIREWLDTFFAGVADFMRNREEAE